MLRFGLPRSVVALSFAFSFFQAHAQTPPPFIPTPSELGERRPPTVTDPGRVPDAPLPVPRRLGTPDDDVALQVKGFTLDASAPERLKAALASLTAPFVGEGKTFADLSNAAREVTRYLQSDLGYYLGYAYIPEQEMRDGVIRIAVLEGRLDAVELIWPDDMPVRKEVVEGYLARLQPGSVLLVRDVERVVFLVNDLRGMSAEFEVKAGTTPGTARLVVRPRAEKLVSYSLEADNANARVLGKYRLTATVTRNSPFGLGDNLTASLIASKGLTFGLASYTAPVGSNGARLGLSVSALKYKVDKDEFPEGLEGSASTISAFGLIPVVRSRNLNLFGLASLDAKSYRDFDGLVKTPKRVRGGSLGFTGDLRDSIWGGGINSMDLQLAFGRVSFDNPPTSDAPDEDFRKLSLRAVRLQNLVPGFLQGYGALRVQKAFNNLDVTEQFRVGGPDGVRAFPPGEGSGDNGALATLELRVIPPSRLLETVGGSAFFSAFVDWAAIEKRNDVSQLDPAFENRADYGGAGLGAVWNGPDGWDIRASLAWPLENEAANEKDRGHRFYAQARKQF